jgi:pSer/pThr/pTyr-binding forkhead associated (FHA) protein
MEPLSDPHRFSAADLQRRLAAERTGSAFVYFRDDSGEQQIVMLSSSAPNLTVGRSAGSAIALEWDDEVSRLHAELAVVGEHWTLVDDGLSSNGSFVNGARISGRRRLRDGDEIRIGSALIVFRDPGDRASAATRISPAGVAATSISPAQRNVLVALCRPYKEGDPYAAPATNKQIAEELVLSVPAVKAHLRALAEKLEVGDLPQNRKRLRLVELAFQTGAVSEREL